MKTRIRKSHENTFLLRLGQNQVLRYLIAVTNSGRTLPNRQTLMEAIKRRKRRCLTEENRLFSLRKTEATEMLGGVNGDAERRSWHS
uniref:Uncharacterized protein n=1 Tax=Picea glauca TaxID=3330 RepID=A0A101M5N0_PICGL|nr:hypothetical protein ABT39_MTgene1171 [Picea glauca]